ncbi:hypothetical protein AAFF_G00210620 [Aldrovandia affinis]|uniref:Uncharacterized protein n=1 Tax=Aldrovandia affinis TaxID=143900 RepID=A0AAD7WUJ4_9TELE|nr:hypothetical protein AAFF_G00210620 [Aldrovandia affinis]
MAVEVEYFTTAQCDTSYKSHRYSIDSSTHSTLLHERRTLLLKERSSGLAKIWHNRMRERERSTDPWRSTHRNSSRKAYAGLHGNPLG